MSGTPPSNLLKSAHASNIQGLFAARIEAPALFRDAGSDHIWSFDCTRSERTSKDGTESLPWGNGSTSQHFLSPGNSILFSRKLLYSTVGWGSALQARGKLMRGFTFVVLAAVAGI